MSEARTDLYRRLMDVQEQIAHARYQRGVSDEVIQDALDRADEQLTDAERSDDLYLAALEHYVDALGGRLELRAIFDDDDVAITVRSTRTSGS